jgi:hypothetical protein
VSLARYGFAAVMVGAALTVVMALLLGGARMVRLQADAAATRVDLVLLDLQQQLDRRARSARALALAAPSAFATLSPDMLAALVDQAGNLIATSNGDRTGDAAPVHWLQPPGLTHKRWRAADLGTAAAGAIVHDDSGLMIGTLVVEGKQSLLPPLLRLFSPSLQWAATLLLALVPAAWFGAALSFALLGREAAAAERMVASLTNREDEEPRDEEVGPELAAFGRGAARGLQGYERAVDAVSYAGSEEARPAREHVGTLA